MEKTCNIQGTSLPHANTLPEDLHQLGGARIITHIYIEGKLVYLLAIYDKSEQKNITDAQILNLLGIINPHCSFLVLNEKFQFIFG